MLLYAEGISCLMDARIWSKLLVREARGCNIQFNLHYNGIRLGLREPFLKTYTRRSNGRRVYCELNDFQIVFAWVSVTIERFGEHILRSITGFMMEKRLTFQVLTSYIFWHNLLKEAQHLTLEGDKKFFTEVSANRVMRRRKRRIPLRERAFYLSWRLGFSFKY